MRNKTDAQRKAMFANMAKQRKYFHQGWKEKSDVPMPEHHSESDVKISKNISENPKKTKYVEVCIIQGNYGNKWETVTAEDKYSEAKKRLHEYNENETQYPHRLRIKKILREKYEKGDY